MSKIDNFKKAASDVFGIGNGAALDLNENMSTDEQVDAILEAEQVPVSEVPASITSRPQSIVSNSTPYVLVPATYLAPGVVMEGTLRSKGDVEIAGTFKGDIISEGDVTLHTNFDGNVTSNNLALIDCSMTGNCTVTTVVKINSNSSVNGNISTAELLCSGSVVGDITVTGNATFESCAIVDGNITAGSIAMERGAKVSGQLNMRG